MEPFSRKLSHPLILASGSPRRSQLLSEMGFTFKVWAKPIDETYPSNMPPFEVAEYLAQQKAAEFNPEEIEDSIVITADTLVARGNEILNKPANKEDALAMMLSLSGKQHDVVTGVCLKSVQKQITFHEITQVTFFPLDKGEIEYYVTRFKPMDKAGAYGIQEWIGNIGVERINGSYNNVVGLPTARLYQHLKTFQELD